MLAKAAPGLKVPKEGKPRDYVTDALIEDLPDTAYYLRRMTDGDLVLATDAEYAAQQKAAAKAVKPTDQGAA